MASVEQIREALKVVFDPEIPINIVDLGLIYRIDLPEAGKVNIDLTLTNPACPIGDQITSKIREVVGRMDGITELNVNLVWDPPWNKEKMTFEGKLQFSMLGFG